MALRGLAREDQRAVDFVRDIARMTGGCAILSVSGANVSQEWPTYDYINRPSASVLDRLYASRVGELMVSLQHASVTGFTGRVAWLSRVQ